MAGAVRFPVGTPPMLVGGSTTQDEVPDVEIVRVENGFVLRHNYYEQASKQLSLPGKMAAAEAVGVDVEEIDHLSPSLQLSKTYVAMDWPQLRSILDNIFEEREDEEADAQIAEIVALEPKTTN